MGGGGPTGGGVRHKMVGSGGRRPDPGLLVPDASRQEAEANYILLLLLLRLLHSYSYCYYYEYFNIL